MNSRDPNSLRWAAIQLTCAKHELGHYNQKSNPEWQNEGCEQLPNHSIAFFLLQSS